MSVTINAFFISWKKKVYFLLEYISEPVLHYFYLCKGAESALLHLPEYLVGIWCTFWRHKDYLFFICYIFSYYLISWNLNFFMVAHVIERPLMITGWKNWHIPKKRCGSDTHRRPASVKIKLRPLDQLTQNPTFSFLQRAPHGLFMEGN